MKDFFTSFSTECDPAGGLVIEFRSAIGFQLIGLAMAPFVATLGYALAGAPLGFPPWPIVGASILGLAALGIAFSIRQRSRSRVRVGIDRARSSVLVDSHNGRTELPINDIDKVEFGSTTVGKGTPVYRLEFVMRNRERVPSTTGYCLASQSDRDKLLEALNHELVRRSAMLS